MLAGRFQNISRVGFGVSLEIFSDFRVKEDGCFTGLYWKFKTEQNRMTTKKQLEAQH